MCACMYVCVCRCSHQVDIFGSMFECLVLSAIVTRRCCRHCSTLLGEICTKKTRQAIGIRVEINLILICCIYFQFVVVFKRQFLLFFSSYFQNSLGASELLARRALMVPLFQFVFASFLLNILILKKTKTKTKNDEKYSYLPRSPTTQVDWTRCCRQIPPHSRCVHLVFVDLVFLQYSSRRARCLDITFLLVVCIQGVLQRLAADAALLDNRGALVVRQVRIWTCCKMKR